jgi:ribosome-associated protein
VTATPDLPAREADAAPARPETSFKEFIYQTLVDKRAEDVVWLDVRGIADFADDFLIATIQNQRQGRAILDAIDREAKRRSARRVGIEGETSSSWILIDYGDVIVHLFLPEQRRYYGLEHIWTDAKRVQP